MLSSSLSICLSAGRATLKPPNTAKTRFRGIFLFGLNGFGAACEHLLPDALLQAFDDASNAFGAQLDSGQRGNLIGAHALAKVEPEDRAVPLLVGTGQPESQA